MNNTYANIDQTRAATYKQFDFAVFKLAERMADSQKINLKIDGKANPKFRILKARIGASVAKFYGDKNQKMTHGDAQKYITTGVIPKEIMALVKTDDAEVKPKAKAKVKAEVKPKAETIWAKEIKSAKKPKAKAKAKDSAKLKQLAKLREMLAAAEAELDAS
jgi:hypothetical protein|tara:strand:+ start:1495 stop:1980 length:486 start_codon:yes stop_codon:yes gene_type:complete